jgi:hypothetical protein
MNRLLVACGAVLAGLFIVALLNAALPADSIPARLLVNKSSGPNDAGQAVERVDPLAVQTFMWIAFMVGLGEIALRFRDAMRERKTSAMKFLPEEPDILLASADLVPVYRRVRKSGYRGFLPRLIERIVLQYQTSKSVDRANMMLTSSLDLFSHEIDLRYHMLRFLSWLLPSLGFLGTVIGLIYGMNSVAVQFNENAGQINLATVVGELSVAFYTTWLALIMAAIIVFLMHVAQEMEENALNQSAQYCLDHLINKLYER